MTSIPRLFVPPIPQKLTEVAQKFYRVIRVIISSVYPTIVRSAKQARLRSPANFFSYEARMRFVGNLVRNFRLLLHFICDGTATSLIFRKRIENFSVGVTSTESGTRFLFCSLRRFVDLRPLSSLLPFHCPLLRFLYGLFLSFRIHGGDHPSLLIFIGAYLRADKGEIY